METNLEQLQGVCKDCGAGTLNNLLNPAFEVEEFDDYVEVTCLKCGGRHVDVVVL